MNRMSKEIKQGLFDYATTFPGSPRAAQFAGPSASIIPTAAGGNSLPSVSAIPDTPTFSDFSVTWRKEMAPQRSEEHTSELQSLMRSSYAVFSLKKKRSNHTNKKNPNTK